MKTKFLAGNMLFLMTLFLLTGSTRGHLRGGAAIFREIKQRLRASFTDDAELKKRRLFAAKDVEKITCPVIGMLIKNKVLVPKTSNTSPSFPFITKEQTKRAMLSIGISMETATKSTRANFKTACSGDTNKDKKEKCCDNCPIKLNPFKMNIIKDNNSQKNVKDKPHEHMLSTGIRDNDENTVDKQLYARVETELFGNKKWEQWSAKKIKKFIGLFDLFEKGCDTKTTFCSNDRAEDMDISSYEGALKNMLKEFQDPSTGLITQEDFKAMWLENKVPSYTSCQDRSWTDRWGKGCDWYDQDFDIYHTTYSACQVFGSIPWWKNAGHTASTACCVCGGGSPKWLSFTPAKFRSENENNENAFCRDGFYKKYEVNPPTNYNTNKYTFLKWPKNGGVEDHSLDKCKKLCIDEKYKCKGISWCEDGSCCSLYNEPCIHPQPGSGFHVSLNRKFLPFNFPGFGG